MKKLMRIYLLLFVSLSSQYVVADASKYQHKKKIVNSFFDKRVISEVVESHIDEGFEGVVAIASDEGIIYSKGAGYAIDNHAKYTLSTVVDIASVSKQFTAAAIVKLAEQNKLNISLPISTYISNVPEDKADITLHHLLTHTAGLKRHSGRDEEKLNRDTFIKNVLTMPLTYPVGDRYHYSNIGYQLLAFVVEIVSGQPFEEYLYNNLLKPAGMFSTGYLKPDWSRKTIPEVKRLYAGFSSPLTMLESTDGEFWNLIGGGGILSTVGDMTLWHLALMNNSVLSDKSQSLMYTPYVNEDEEGFYYGYGWSVVPRDNKEPLIWHNGMSFFGKAEYWRFPESGLMIFVSSHKESVSPWHLANSISKALDL
ncbi:serine hydrolase domain-containing protein [Planctobacterium marinum]|uniref:serine hydrolase domain-containing protein n=1 Tax=Planctobacterium marinum TaxID=1631968 RepID=UPI001E283D67|nr:serine hydrolase domain-containing protein [Planctobacterium marinum]MCC2605727.1 beta-lactamase family protein [Planctobacterium marinum]